MTAAVITPAIVGALKCQQQSFLKTFTTTVISCEEELPVATPKNKKKSKTPEEPATKKYAVELADTILFPEGGGQPSDTGVIVDKETGKTYQVGFIRRDNLKAIHLTNEPLEIGKAVELQLNWKRRLDHMQQHTGQHLLSAILDKYELPTLSWSMGELINYIEIPRQLTEEEVTKISEEVNDKIQEAIDITVEIPHKDDVKKNKLPGDYDVEKGVLRVIKIGNLDQNPCCGTHLQSTSQIVSIALLHQTSVRGTNSRLHFLAGDRVRQFAVSAHKILKQTSQDLSCQTEEITDKIGLLNINYRKSIKKESQWRETVAQYQSAEILEALTNKDAVFVYKADVGLDYLLQLFKNVSKEVKGNKVLVLLSGEGKEGGSVIIYSEDSEKSLEIGKQLQSFIKNLKGGGKGKWQGKISTYEKGELDAALEYLNSL